MYTIDAEVFAPFYTHLQFSTYYFYRQSNKENYVKRLKKHMYMLSNLDKKIDKFIFFKKGVLVLLKPVIVIKIHRPGLSEINRKLTRCETL